MESLIYDIWFKTLKINGHTKKRLIDCFETSKTLYNTTKQSLKKFEGIKEDVINTIITNKDLNKVKKIYDTMKEKKIKGVPIYSENYPVGLKEIYNPPFMLYVLGSLRKEVTNSIAVVGARKATAYGKWSAYNIAYQLGLHNITVSSGMAFGADTYAHQGALDAEGRTIAVLGCGIDICYPKNNYSLYESIIKEGAVISEYEPGICPHPAFFPARNRIISGLSKAVVVVEAGEKSGSLITAEFALNQGRDVYAVPGNIESKYSKGTNKLIKDGAIPIIGIEEFLQDLNITRNEKQNDGNIELGADEKRVLEIVMENQPVGIDFLAYKLNMQASEMNAILTILEIKGIVKILSGKIVIAK